MTKLQSIFKKYREKCQNTENTEKMPKYRANIKIQSNRDLCHIDPYSELCIRLNHHYYKPTLAFLQLLRTTFLQLLPTIIINDRIMVFQDSFSWKINPTSWISEKNEVHSLIFFYAKNRQCYGNLVHDPPELYTSELLKSYYHAKNVPTV